jgi:hypothetical protein
MVVQNMAASEYVRFLKSARMLQAENAMIDIQSSSFPSYKEDDQKKVMRDLKRASTANIFRPLKDFAEVAANFAKRLKDG